MLFGHLLCEGPHALFDTFFFCGGYQVSSSSGSWIACKIMGTHELISGLYKILVLVFGFGIF